MSHCMHTKYRKSTNTTRIYLINIKYVFYTNDTSSSYR